MIGIYRPLEVGLNVQEPLRTNTDTLRWVEHISNSNSHEQTNGREIGTDVTHCYW